MSTTPFRTLAGLAASVALVSGGVVLSTTAAQAVQAPNQCPAVFPADDLADGQDVTGLTTTKGTEPDQFTGEYVSTLANGIGKGRDLLIFKMAGSRITEANGDVDAGIWAGMSGSPVYADDGRLIGAVSYGFSLESSDYAGVTPAQYMYDLRTPLAAAPAARLSPERVKLPTRVKSSVVRDGVSAKTAADGMHRLAPARFVIGASTRDARTFARRAGFDYSGYLAGAGAAATTQSYPIAAGGNFAASVSYGDIGLVGVGTATAVCSDGEILAYGHPSQFTGKSLETVHGASAAFIQADSTGGGSYKLANIGSPAGSLLQDRLQGVLGKLGTIPAATTVTTQTTADGKTYQGQTKVSDPDALSFVTALQASSDTVYALNQDVGGDALVSWTIDFKRKDGQNGTLSRTQHYSAAQRLSLEVPNDVASDVGAIVDNGFERVAVSAVHITSKLSPAYQAVRIAKVQYRAKGAWHRVSDGGSLKTKPGSTVKLRLTFTPADFQSEAKTTTKVVSWKMSRNARRSGAIKLDGNAVTLEDEFFFEEEIASLVDRYKPESFEELLFILDSPTRQDNMSTRLSYRTKWGHTHRYDRQVRAPGVVFGSYLVRLVLK